MRYKKFHKNGEPKTFIIQKYLKPFLYNNRKFDIRHYLLITSVNGLIKGYWYKSGYIRTSSEKFDLEDIENEFIHLTNDAIQKNS
jgi:tubulin polyglutamylase TTLL1